MQTFKELLENKPSKAVRAMVAGLREARTFKDFQFDMNTFGSAVESNLCIGCVATATVMKVANLRFTTDNINCLRSRAKAVQISSADLLDFESAIDRLRKGLIGDLLRYFLDEDDYRVQIRDPRVVYILELWQGSEQYVALPRLTEDFTEEDLAKYERLAEYFELKDL